MQPRQHGISKYFWAQGIASAVDKSDIPTHIKDNLEAGANITTLKQLNFWVLNQFHNKRDYRNYWKRFLTQCRWKLSIYKRRKHIVERHTAQGDANWKRDSSILLGILSLRNSN